MKNEKEEEPLNSNNKFTNGHYMELMPESTIHRNTIDNKILYENWG